MRLPPQEVTARLRAKMGRPDGSISVPVWILREAVRAYDLMLRCSQKSCPPLHYLLTQEGLYGFHMANLWVRNDGVEYVMEADWADEVGKLVKKLTELLAVEIPDMVEMELSESISRGAIRWPFSEPDLKD